MSIRNKLALAALLLGVSAAQGDGISNSMTPQLGGGIGTGFDGGISSTAAVAAPVTPCSQTGLIFTSSCNAILYVVLF